MGNAVPLQGVGDRMRTRFVLPLVLFALVAAACGGGADVPVGTEVHGQFTTNAAGATVSPDFTLTLADGETRSLAEQQKPTIILFWANW
jgi:cytochrome oxidase Cu insertion factor (SCO1/SenC/PrrC family)